MEMNLSSLLDNPCAVQLRTTPTPPQDNKSKLLNCKVTFFLFCEIVALFLNAECERMLVFIKIWEQSRFWNACVAFEYQVPRVVLS